ncbi:MAG: hypothetical protein ACK53Y_27770, partial [bacterium]
IKKYRLKMHFFPLSPTLILSSCVSISLYTTLLSERILSSFLLALSILRLLISLAALRAMLSSRSPSSSRSLLPITYSL